MDETMVRELLKLLDGTTQMEWNVFRGVVEHQYKLRASKLQLEGTEQLAQSIVRELEWLKG